MTGTSLDSRRNLVRKKITQVGLDSILGLARPSWAMVNESKTLMQIVLDYVYCIE
jgi:hypothetical protein